MAKPRIDTPLRLTLAYVFFGILCMLGSDGILALWRGNSLEHWTTDSLRGLLFILVTAAILYPLAKRLVAQYIASQARLHDSEERLSLALESANQGLYDLNIQTGETVVNDTYAAMLGYDPAGFHETRATLLERLHPGDRESVKQALEEYLAGQRPEYRVEFRLGTRSGEWKWILSLGRIVERDAAGRPLRLIGTHTDITGVKSAEERTMDALAFSRTILRATPIGVSAYGPEGRTVLANEALAQMVGTDVPGLLQQNFRELASWRQHGLLAAAEQALATGKTVMHAGQLRSSFGRSLWIEAQFIPFHHQNTKHLLLIMNDVTEQRRTLESLELLNTAVQAATTGWVITNAEGIIEFVNPGFTAMTGYALEEAVGRKTSILKSGRQSAAFYADMWDTIRRGEVWHGELENSRKDGSFYHEQMTIAPVRDTQGRIAHYVAIKHDISERKKLEQQITRTQRLESIGLLASGIAHDLNNILAPITLSLELLKIKYPDADGRKIVEVIESSAQRAVGIVRQVLTFARGMDGARGEVRPEHLLEEIRRLVDETFPRNIQTESDIAPGVWPLTCDITQLHQVLLNLAVNARDAMPGGGVLHLGACNVTLNEEQARRAGVRAPGCFTALTVRDTGTGIPPEVLERMFEPFYTTKPLGKGTGLGLSTVYGIMRSHGGAVEVNTKLGEGTEFRLLLPAVTATMAHPELPAARPVALAGAGRHVLVVDDEDVIRQISAELLKRHGFAVETAVDGLDGLEKFRRRQSEFDLVLTDLMMPRMSGYQLAAEIRKIDPGVPIVASSGMAGEETADKVSSDLAALGIRTLLIKPYREEQLLRTLEAELAPPAGQKKD